MRRTGTLWAYAFILFALIACDDSTLEPNKNKDTIQSAPTINQHPQDVTICGGLAVTFSVKADGDPAPTYQWEINENGTWETIIGATDVAYVVNPVTPQMDGNRYRVIVTNSDGSVTSDAATLTIDCDAPIVTQHPQNFQECEGQTVVFEAAATGNPAPSIQWQQNDGSGWVDIPGEISQTLVIINVPFAMRGYQYRAVFTNSEGSAITDPATLLVDIGPIILKQPVDMTVKTNAKAQFDVDVDAYPTATYQWQVSYDMGITWADMPGENSATVIINPASTDDNGAKFRCILENRCGKVVSGAATLTVL